MDRKVIAGAIVGVLFNGVVLPLILELLDASKQTKALIVAASVFVMLALFVWGYAAKGLSWGVRMLPIVLMLVGLAMFGAGALWYYGLGQKAEAKKPEKPSSLPTQTRAIDLYPLPSTVPTPSPTKPLTVGQLNAERERQAAIQRSERTRAYLEASKSRDLEKSLDQVLKGIRPAPRPTIAEDVKADLSSKRALITEIVQDWKSANDGQPETQAALLDKATPYINDQLRVRGQKWTFDRYMRKLLGFPPAVGDTYEND
jgi:hypothetical protein